MVPKYRRNCQPLEVLNSAENLLQELIRITSKEKVFPLKRHIMLADPLIENCRKMCYAMQYANSLSLNYMDQRQMRREQQFKVLEYASYLQVDIKVSHMILKYDLGIMQHVADLITEVRNKTVAWMKSDTARVVEMLRSACNAAGIADETSRLSVIPEEDLDYQKMLAEVEKQTKRLYEKKKLAEEYQMKRSEALKKAMM